MTQKQMKSLQVTKQPDLTGAFDEYENRLENRNYFLKKSIFHFKKVIFHFLETTLNLPAKITSPHQM